MGKTKKIKVEEEVKVEEVKEVALEVNDNLTGKILDSLTTQEYLNQNREELFKEVPNLITADFFENPPRVMLTVSKPLKELPVKEHNGLKIIFDQMVLGGVVGHKDTAPVKDSVISTPTMTADMMDPTFVFGRECLGPHNAKARNEGALEAWKKRHPSIKVVG